MRLGWVIADREGRIRSHGTVEQVDEQGEPTGEGFHVAFDVPADPRRDDEGGAEA